MESPRESLPNQDQLALRSQGRQTQVPLQKEIFQTVKDLADNISVAPQKQGLFD
jgi:hypothetical protein